MENILEHCEPSESQNETVVKTETIEPAPEAASSEEIPDTKDKSDDVLDINDVVESSSKSILDDDKNAESTDTDTDTKPDTQNDSRDMNISFDEDIILPSVRHDPEIEQKQRDRIKRKEIKSRKELEEEEREKMQ